MEKKETGEDGGVSGGAAEASGGTGGGRARERDGGGLERGWRSAPNERVWRWVAPGAVALGVAMLVGLATALHPPVHVAGDGALKQFQMETWAERGGFASMAIAWPEVEPWVAELWEEFHAPIEPPFVYEGKLVFPPLFLALSFPFYLAAGYWGLFVLPSLSAVGLWLVVWRTCRALELGPAGTGVAMAGLALSPVTFFGMMFWEHVPALFLVALGMHWALRGQASRLKSGLAGLAIGVGVALRPELAVAGVGLLVYFVANEPRRPVAFAGLAAAVGLWAWLNLAATGSVVGVHAEQPLMIEGEGGLERVVGWYGGLVVALVRQYPVATVAVVGSLVVMRGWGARGVGAGDLRGGKKGATAGSGRRDERAEPEKTGRPGRVVLVAIALATLVVLPFMVPYAGVIHGFRRWELVIVPVGAVLAGMLVRDWPVARWVLLAALAVQAVGVAARAREFVWAHGERIVPVVEAIEARRPAAVFSDSQYPLGELAGLMDETPMLWAPPAGELPRLFLAATEHIDLEEAVFVIANPPTTGEIGFGLPDGSHLRLRPLHPAGAFYGAYEIERVGAE